MPPTDGQQTTWVSDGHSVQLLIQPPEPRLVVSCPHNGAEGDCSIIAAPDPLEFGPEVAGGLLTPAACRITLFLQDPLLGLAFLCRNWVGPPHAMPAPLALAFCHYFDGEGWLIRFSAA